ncbi:dynamin family protein [Heyndrickxia sporothermodurans]
MTKTIETKPIKELNSELISLVKRFKQNGDIERTNKAKRLLKKVYDQDFILAFCGHFSAGKSTMINSLLGENVLPSSPIPTSANLVKVHKANEDFAKVFYHDQSPLLFQAPYDFSKVKEFCKNGDVREIEIGQATSKLENGVTVMDTPGVDSTDDAHRISTESAIHLADIVFYVMDYNHVQSELNFTYTKELIQNGVELYLIINQIDKHNENELSFSDFQASVRESFATWDVHPKGIFYTTLKKPEDSKNQFMEVKQLIQSSIMQKNEKITGTVKASINILTQEHYKWLKEKQEEKADRFDTIVNNYPEEKKSTIFADEEKTFNELKQLEERPEKWKELFEKELEKILNNAYLMPFQTRELAEKYLASIQSDFKVGLLFGKKKTENERKDRLNAFYHSLKTQVDSQLNWHFRQFATNLLKEANLIDDELQSLAQSLAVEFDSTTITDAVQPGARLTGEYVLNYCDQIAGILQKNGRSISREFKERVLIKLTQESKIEYELVAEKWKKISEVAEAYRGLEQLEHERLQKEERIHQPISNSKENFDEILKEWEVEEKTIRIYSEKQTDKKSTVKSKEQTRIQDRDEEIESFVSVDDTLVKLNQAVSLLKGRKGFQRLTDILALKAERLENREYTIALFGAFSAGKSSFANALLGDKVLPVSPNPTTAAINRICPPTNENEHGTSIVYLKSEQHVLDDVQKSLKLFGVHCDNLREAEEKIPNVIQQVNGDGKEKVQLSFLKAFLKGFSEFKDLLGKKIKTDLKEFRDFVAIESKSCFVESIDLYYDSELARKGITLVDTPGADSINARHTGVAFEYIKNSDAILFVTYYNHAFSKADREFLIQLGRVKDAFELDKMFFIINAIDLADTEEELNEVQEYVHGQLTQYGIRFPRIFGVSSLFALTEEKHTSRIDIFKEHFNHFLNQDLMKMTIQSAENEYQKGLQLLDRFIASALEGKEEKRKKKQELLTQKDQINEVLSSSSPQLIMKKALQEQKELLFYVKQRVFYRFSDFFKEAFNPALIQKNDRGALKIALDDLLQSIGYDFAQELRATTLRLENYVRDAFNHLYEQLVEQMIKIQEDIQISSFECKSVKTPEFPNAFENISKDGLEKTFKYFKNAKSFFEKNEKQLIQSELEELIQPLADHYLSLQGETMQNYYTNYIEQEFERMIENQKEDLTEQFNGWFDILNEEIDVNEWMDIRDQLAM